MPQLDRVVWTIWLACIVSQFSTLLFVWWRGLAKQWPSLVCFLSIKSLVDFLLLGITLATSFGDARVAPYFRIYWLGEGLAALAQMWMVIQIGSTLVGGSQKAVRAIWISVPVVAIICVFAYSHLDLWPNYGPGPQLKVVSTIIGLQRVIAIAWLTTFLSIAAFSDFLGIRWRRHPFGIAIGFAIQSTTAILFSWFLQTLTFANARFLSNLSGLAYLLTLSVWALTLSRPEPIYDMSPSIKAALGSALIFRRAFQRNLAK